MTTEPAPAPAVAVVVLTYHADAERLAACLASVAAATSTSRIIVVDNGATLTPADVAAATSGAATSGHEVELLQPGENRGYAGGMNVGLAHALAAGHDAVAVLNDDTVVRPDWIERLLPHLAAGAGAVQPKLLLPDGRLQSLGVRLRADGAGIDIGYGEPDTVLSATASSDTAPAAGTVHSAHSAHSVELLSGGAVLFARRLLETVGGFDERYFLYYEDIDLSLRAGAAGFRLVVEPAAVVEHAMSTTTLRQPAVRRYYQERNRLWCLARHRGWRQLALGLVRSAARCAKHPTTKAQWRATLDGLRGVSARRRERRHRVTLLCPLDADRLGGVTIHAVTIGRAPNDELQDHESPDQRLTGDEATGR